MISGTYVFTDTINSTFDKVFEDANEGVDVVVSGRSEFDTDEGAVSQEIPDSLVDRVKQVPGVLVAAGNVEDAASIFKENGDQIKTGGAPPLLFSRPPERFDPLNYVEGEPPANPGEVAINKGTADDENLKIGDRVSLVGRSGRENFTISGLATFGDVESLGGATVSVVTLPQAQRLADQPGQVDSIQVAARAGRDPGRAGHPHRAGDAEHGRGEDRSAGSRRRGRVDPEQPQLPQHPAAGVRRDRGVRGRVHHLQHVLDHRRAAHQGVRAAADDGRLARPGAALGDAGGADRRA